MSQESDIQNFYKDQKIFLTGGTGFLGKILIEKLLRSCHDLDKLYMLVRPKKGKTVEERFEEIFGHPCFDLLKTQRPGFRSKVIFISGDCQKPNLGLSQTDRELLTKDVSILIHAAANVRFNLSLKIAAHDNVKPVGKVIQMAKEMPNLKVLVYVSTAYSNCPRSHIDEQFYKPPLTAEGLFQLVEELDDETLVAITPHLLGKWPNTYTYSKAIAEDLVRRTSGNLPMVVVRPSIVYSTAKEPMPGWIDNFYGIPAVGAAIYLGLLRSLHVDRGSRINLVPCDYVANTVIATAWDFERRRLLKKPEPTTNSAPEGSNIFIYNYTDNPRHPLRLTQIIDDFLPSGYKEYPFSQMIWYNFFTATEYRWYHEIRVFLFHTLQAYLIDLGLWCLGKPTMAVKAFKKLDSSMDMLSYFHRNQWKFQISHVEDMWKAMGDSDRKVFNFNMEDIDWRMLFRNSIIGGRVFLLKDKLETLPYAKKKQTVLAVVHYAVVALLLYIVYKIVMVVFNLF